MNKEDDAVPKILDPVQERENLTVGSMVKSKQENKNVKESGKEGSITDPKMLEHIQEMENQDMGSAKKREQTVSSADSPNVRKAKIIEFHKKFCNKRWGVKERICKNLKRYVLGLL